jgi:hypothetical protein
MLVRCNNTQAVAAVTRGATRVRDGRSICKEIALLAIRHGFVVEQDTSAAWSTCGADRLSRHLEAARRQQLRLLPTNQPTNHPPTAVLGNTVPAARGLLLRRAGRKHAGGLRRVLLPGPLGLGSGGGSGGQGPFHRRSWPGRRWTRSPRLTGCSRWGTRATVVVPDWPPERTWHRQYVRTPSSVVRRDGTLRAGIPLCLWPSARVADRSLPPARPACRGWWLRRRAQDDATPAVGVPRSRWCVAKTATSRSSAETYMSHWRRFSRFCDEQLGLSNFEVFPRDRAEDLNPMLVCLFVTYAASRYAASMVEGTLSALAHWQRSRGVRPGDTVSHHPRVNATLARALCTRSPAQADGSAAKAPRTLGLLIGWLAARAGSHPETALRHASDACWLVIRFFGLLRSAELFALTPANITDLPGGGVSVWIARSKADQSGRGATVCFVVVVTVGSRPKRV